MLTNIALLYFLEAVYDRLSKRSARMTDAKAHRINSRSSEAIDHISHANNPGQDHPSEQPKPKLLPVCEVFNFSDGQIYELATENEKVERMTAGDKHSANRKHHTKKIKKVHLEFSNTEKKETQEHLPKILQNMQRHYSNHKLVYIPTSGLPMVCNMERTKQTIDNMAQLQVGPQDRLLKEKRPFKQSRDDKGRSMKRHDVMMTEVDWDELRSKIATRGGESRGSSLYHSPVSSSPCSPHSELDMTSASPWPDHDQYLQAVRELNSQQNAGQTNYNGLPCETTFQLSPGDPFVLPAIEKSNSMTKSKHGIDQRIEQKFEQTLKIYKRTREKILSMDKIKEKEQKYVRSGKRRRKQFPIELSVQRIEGARPVENIVKTEATRVHSTETDAEATGSALQSQKSKIELKFTQRKSSTKLPPITQTPKSTTRSGKEKVNTPPKKTTGTPQKKMFAECDYDQFSHRKLKTKAAATPRTPRTKQASQNQISRQYDRNEAMQYIKVKIGDDDKKERCVPAETGIIPEEESFTEYDKTSIYTSEERATPPVMIDGHDINDT